MKILIIVLSFSDNGGIYDKFYLSQKNTWDSVYVEDVSTYYNFGGSLENYITGDRINVNTSEGIINCGIKTIEAFKLILEKNIDFDYVFRTNSSSYVDKSKLKSFLEDKPRTGYYAGACGNYDGFDYVSGSGIILSKDLVKLISDEKQKMKTKYIDDVMIGEFLKENGVFPKNIYRFNIHNTRNFNFDDDYFLYRCKSNDRNIDVDNLYLIHNLKKNKV